MGVYFGRCQFATVIERVHIDQICALEMLVNNVAFGGDQGSEYHLR